MSVLSINNKSNCNPATENVPREVATDEKEHSEGSFSISSHLTAEKPFSTTVEEQSFLVAAGERLSVPLLIIL